MDKAAMGLAMEHNLPLVVFDATKPDNIFRAASGQDAGTTIG
jgi:uridylate kinase